MNSFAIKVVYVLLFKMNIQYLFKINDVLKCIDQHVILTEAIRQYFTTASQKIMA